MQFENKVNKIISEMNTDEISKLKSKLQRLKNDRDHARSKEEGGDEHVNLTNQIKKIQQKLKDLTGKYS